MKRRFLALACVWGAAGWVSSTSGATTSDATCPSHDMVTSAQLTTSGGTASVSFTVAAGCKDVQLSLVELQGARRRVQRGDGEPAGALPPVTGTFPAGSNTVSVAMPNCYYQVDFVYGTAIEHLTATRPVATRSRAG